MEIGPDNLLLSEILGAEMSPPRLYIHGGAGRLLEDYGKELGE